MKLKILGGFCFILCLLFALPLFCGQGNTFADKEYCQVVASECCIYEEANFDKPLKDSNGETISLKHGQALKVIEGEKEGFIKVEFSAEEVYQGYVYARHVTFNKLSQEIYPVFNASVVAEEAQVYDLNEEPTDIKLTKGKELYLYKGYHKKENMTFVCFIQEDGSLYYGKIITKDLAPYGINAGVITGIVVAVSCATIILLLLFMKKTKKAKKIEKK